MRKNKRKRKVKQGNYGTVSEFEKGKRQKKAVMKRKQKLMQGKGKPTNNRTKELYRRAKEERDARVRETLDPIFILGEDDFWINPIMSDSQLDLMQELAEKIYYEEAAAE